MEENTFKVGDKVYLAPYETIITTTQISQKNYLIVQAEEPLTIAKIIINPNIANITIIVAEFPTSVFAPQWLSMIPCNSFKPRADLSSSANTSQEEFNKYVIDRIKELHTNTSRIKRKLHAEIKPPTSFPVISALTYIDYPQTLIEEVEWEQYSSLLKEFYLTHDKSEQPPIMKGITGYYSIMKPLSNEKFNNLNIARGWEYK